MNDYFRMMKKHQNVDYEVVKLNNRRKCEHPECDNRRRYGIKTVKSEDVSIFGLYIGFKSRSSVKFHCPDHRPEHDLAEKARRKEHKYAKKHYRNFKEEQQMEEYKKIINSNFIPTFIFKGRRGLVMEGNDKFTTENIDREEAIGFVKSFDVDDPILFVERHKNKYKIIKDNEIIESEKASYNSDISYADFENKYGEYKFRTRDYFVLKTTNYTSVDYQQKPISRIENHVGEVVEWREFDEHQGNLVLDYCPVCGRDGLYSSRLFYSRVVSDEEEKICVCHERCECIIGCLNSDLIDEDAYEIGLIE